MSLAVCSPDTLPIATQLVTNTSHSAIARHGWVALQRASRTVSGRRSATVEEATALPFDACELLASMTLPTKGLPNTGAGSPAKVDFSLPPPVPASVRM